MNHNLHRVVKVEYHYLPSCPCSDCVSERNRQGLSHVEESRQVSLPPDAAYLLGFISKRSPEGSVARRLLNQ
jgi:hypothetical protein